jgi:hypothetical protein
MAIRRLIDRYVDWSLMTKIGEFTRFISPNAAWRRKKVSDMQEPCSNEVSFSGGRQGGRLATGHEQARRR